MLNKLDIRFGAPVEEEVLDLPDRKLTKEQEENKKDTTALNYGIIWALIFLLAALF